MMTTRFLPSSLVHSRGEPLLMPGWYPVISSGDLFGRGKKMNSSESSGSSGPQQGRRRRRQRRRRRSGKGRRSEEGEGEIEKG